MNQQDFNIHAARRLENIRLSMLLEQSAVQRDIDLGALLRAAAARGGAISGGLLKREVDIIFTATETMIERAIAYRKELARRAPGLLLAFPHLKELHAKLDQFADGAVLAFKARHAGNPPAGPLPVGVIDAVMGEAVRRATALKTRINNEIQAMALEGTLGMHREDQPQVNISNSTIANLNLGTVVGDLNGSIQILTTAGQTELADAVRQLTEAISASGELTHKKDMLENLAYVSEQAALPTEKPTCPPERRRRRKRA